MVQTRLPKVKQGFPSRVRSGKDVSRKGRGESCQGKDRMVLSRHLSSGRRRQEFAKKIWNRMSVRPQDRSNWFVTTTPTWLFCCRPNGTLFCVADTCYQMFSSLCVRITNGQIKTAEDHLMISGSFFWLVGDASGMTKKSSIDD